MATVDLDVARRWGTAGPYRIIPLKYSGPASYVAGGDAFTDADVGAVIEVAPDLIATNGSVTRLAVYNYTTQKYLWYVPDTGAEVAGGVDLSGYSARAVFWCR